VRSLAKVALNRETDEGVGRRPGGPPHVPILAIILAFACSACGSGTKAGHPPEAKPASMAWRRLGSWTGHGNAQTESFDIGFSQIRIRWETRNEASPGAGTFAVTVNSAVSGRDLALAVDHRGAGGDTAYVSVDPHYSYLVIDSKNLDWSVIVEEPGAEPAGQNLAAPAQLERVYNCWPVPDRCLGFARREGFSRAARFALRQSGFAPDWKKPYLHA
jgi:hypothetical protein